MVKVKEDLTGRRFGKLVVIEQAEDYVSPSNNRLAQWKCKCDCGRETICIGVNLTRGKSKSCGCGHRTQVQEYGICDVRLTDDEYIKYVYTLWSNILCRCFDLTTQNKYPTYQGCTIDQQWRHFSNFLQWFTKNDWYSKYATKSNRVEVDKDLLIKGNMTYSSDTCVVVPHQINSLLNKHKANRGEYPIGVNFNKRKGKFVAQISIKGKTKTLGYFDNCNDAFDAYKAAKETYIKQIADEYKAKYPDFPQKLYDAMYAYEVKITD